MRNLAYPRLRTANANKLLAKEIFHMSLTDLTGKVALVTGSSRGLGRHYALELARAGADVIIHDIDANAASQFGEASSGPAVAEEIRSLDRNSTFLAADLTDAAQVETLVQSALKQFGRIDILHNNVGTTVMGGPMELSEEAWNRSLDINLGSVYRTSKAVLPHMLKQGRGAIINISSLAAIRWTGYPYFAYYTAKAAVNQATATRWPVAATAGPFTGQASIFQPSVCTGVPGNHRPSTRRARRISRTRSAVRPR